MVPKVTPFSCHSWYSIFFGNSCYLYSYILCLSFFSLGTGVKTIAKFLVGGGVKIKNLLVVPLKFMGVPPPGGKFKWNSPNLNPPPLQAKWSSPNATCLVFKNDILFVPSGQSPRSESFFQVDPQFLVAKLTYPMHINCWL